MCVYVKLNNKKSENPAIKLREREREKEKQRNNEYNYGYLRVDGP